MLIMLMCTAFILIGCIAAASLIATAEEAPGNSERQAEVKRRASVAIAGPERLK